MKLTYCLICRTRHAYDCDLTRLLDLFNSKARCVHTLPTAERIYKKLRTRLPVDRVFPLLTAVEHYAIGEDPGGVRLALECEKLKVWASGA